MAVLLWWSAGNLSVHAHQCIFQVLGGVETLSLEMNPRNVAPQDKVFWPPRSEVAFRVFKMFPKWLEMSEIAEHLL